MPDSLIYLASDDYARHTGGYIYNSRLVDALTRQGSALRHFRLGTGFPTVPQAERQRLAQALAAAPAATRILTDHIHLCDLVEEIGEARLPVTAIFHHALAMEHAGMPDEALRALRLREAAALRHADRVLATSQESRRYLTQECGVEPSRILVRVPGTPGAQRRAAGERADTGRSAQFELLSVGAVICRKRYDYLLDVATAICDLAWRWRIVGDPTRDPALFGHLTARADRLGLGDRLIFLGAVPDQELEALWQEADLMLAASHYEGYGMAIAEALRHGVPVVTTASGAVAGWASAGVVEAPADDAAAMANLVRSLLCEPARLQDLADTAFSFGRTLPSWEETFEGMATWMVGAG